MSTEFYGWTGKYIRVDLTRSAITVVEDNLELMKNYLSAREIGIKTMMDEIDPKIDAFEPQNRFIIATGPLTCMPPAGNRTYFVTKSPLTGGIANAGVGGYFGAELKFAGFDFIIVQGKAGRPAYLWIHNDKIELRSAEHIWGKGEGPEYESVASLGAVTGVDNLPAVIKAGRICNDMGMDTISAGVTVGCAMELFERGHLPEKDVGYKLNFGNADALLDLVEKMATRDGFGWILGEGSYRLADRYDHPELSMTVKKQELPNYDPRGVKGQGLAFVTNNRGADHCRAEVNCSEIYETTMLGYWSPEKDVDALNKIGERIFTLERLFNLKAGLSAKDDTLPKRFLDEPMPEGPSKGQVFEQDQILPEYYRMRGCNQQGVP